MFVPLIISAVCMALAEASAPSWRDRPALGGALHTSLTPAAPPRTLHLLRGGGSADFTVAPAKSNKKAATDSLTTYLACSAIVVVWICIATLVFSYNEGWPLAQSLFYAVDTGMSIGFGAVAEERLSTKAFTIVHVLLGASAVGGAIALFAESVVESSPSLASDEYTRAALSAAFARADKDNSGSLSVTELSSVLVGLGLSQPAHEVVKTIQCFDTNGDGSITIDEFRAAVEPHLTGGVTVEEGVRLAVRRRTEPVWVRALRGSWVALHEHRAIVLWAIWILGGAAWWLSVEGGDIVTALYFAVGGLATGGLQAPSLTKQGTLADSSAVFVALYCLSGIPIFAMALGKFAHLFVAKLLAARERRMLEKPISADEFAFAEQIFKADGKVDLSEYMALELLRVGKVDVSMLKIIKSRFNRLDADNDGKLSKAEVLNKGHL
ncbi:hypothetical protein AB1Y20_019027 [Prymnesium parvum]|uniref:EF-hand domain-containing protein n=1 Tax=Prymnesium parvum TaxID=97485 RepID=A0AB34JQ42_PRYPA